MITSVKQFTFDAAHFLPNYDGPCRNLHGHTYKLVVGFSGALNLKTGMVVDFSKIKELLTPLISKLDHSFLNVMAIEDFPVDNPTAENMVSFLIQYIKDILERESKLGSIPVGIHLNFIQLWETPTSYAEWRN